MSIMSNEKILDRVLDMPQKASEVRKFQGFHRRAEKWIRRSSLSTLLASFVMAATGVTSLVLGVRTSMWHEERAKAIQKQINDISDTIIENHQETVENQNQIVKNQQEMSDNQSVISENQYILQSDLISKVKELQEQQKSAHTDLMHGNAEIYKEILRLIPTDESLLLRKDVMDRFHKTFEYLSSIALRQDGLYHNTNPQKWTEINNKLDELRLFLIDLSPKLNGTTLKLPDEAGSKMTTLVTDGSTIYHGG